MRALVTTGAAILVAGFLTTMLAHHASAADARSERVVVMYFHRTQRCPTCLRMGSYSEEAVRNGFAQQLKDGKVVFYYVDFQDPRNAALAKGYGITGPALIVARIANNKVVQFANLTEIWTKVADKAAFLKYVRDGVSAYDAPGDRVVTMYFHRTQRCPTCLKMGGYSEEAVKSGFARQIKEGKAAFYYVDFQDRRNAALAKRYDVSGPALIVAKLVDNKVVEFKNLKDIWTKVADKPAFLKYVYENVAAYRQDNSSRQRP